MSDTKRLSRRAFGALAAAAPVAAIAQQQTANPGNAPNPNTAAQRNNDGRRVRQTCSRSICRWISNAPTSHSRPSRFP